MSLGGYGFVYKTTCIITGLIYVGQTTTLESIKYFGSGVKIKQSLSKYGCENHVREILTWAGDQESLDATELFFISHLDSANPAIGLNILDGKGRWFGGFGDEAEEEIEVMEQINDINCGLEELHNQHIGQGGLVGMRVEDWLTTQ